MLWKQDVSRGSILLLTWPTASPSEKDIMNVVILKPPRNYAVEKNLVYFSQNSQTHYHGFTLCFEVLH